MAAKGGRPLPELPLPAPLCATDGKADGAQPEDVFTWDTVTTRMPKILDSVVETLPDQDPQLLEGIRRLQREMVEGAQLQLLTSKEPRVNAGHWNEALAPFIEKGEGWHDAPWWTVENYMYKRLMEELATNGKQAANYDPFEPQKLQALEVAVAALETSVKSVLEVIESAEAQPLGHPDRRNALEAALLRSLWGNQADLSLSAGKVAAEGGDNKAKDQLLSDHTSKALDLISSAEGREIVIVLDNHGLEVICDLVLVDALLQLSGCSSVALHVKDSPIFVSDVTEADVPGILDWLEGRMPPLASRLRSWQKEGRLKVVSSDYYTTALPFWQLPEDLESMYREAAVVFLKGDANFRRLLGDLHWAYDTDFQKYTESFWPSDGLVSLRTMKSGVAIGIPEERQTAAKAQRPSDWLTSGVFGQVLAATGRGA